MIRGFHWLTTSYVRPRRSMEPMALFSINKSLISISLRMMSFPSGVCRSAVMEYLLRLWALKLAERFHGRSPGSRSGYVEMARLASSSLVARAGPRLPMGFTLTDSTRITSAPMSPRNIVE